MSFGWPPLSYITVYTVYSMVYNVVQYTIDDIHILYKLDFKSFICKKYNLKDDLHGRLFMTYMTEDNMSSNIGLNC